MYHVWYANNTKKKKKREEEEEDTRSMHMCKHWILSELLKIIIIITKQRIKLFKKWYDRLLVQPLD